MSVRIETVEQLQNTKLVEQVLDRLRRTTQPRQFAFKKRCKLLGDKPVLITAPPGRKIKSSLLRELRLGTPTLKGIVHREKQRLIFTFTKKVNVADTTKWIAKCMHDAKSPVPLKCIIIRDPSNANQPILENTPEPTDKPLHIPNADLETEQIDELVPQQDDHDEAELGLDNISDPPSLDALLQHHISSKKMRWIIETEQALYQWRNELELHTQKGDIAEVRLHTLENNLETLQQSLSQLPQEEVTEANPWPILYQQCFESDLQLDTFRTILDHSSLNTTTLLKELQFFDQEAEIKALKTIREYCTDRGEIWQQEQLSPEKKQLQERIQHLEVEHTGALINYEMIQETINTLELKIQETLQKLSKRKLSVYQQLRDKIQGSEESFSVITVLREREQQCHALLSQ